MRIKIKSLCAPLAAIIVMLNFSGCGGGSGGTNSGPSSNSGASSTEINVAIEALSKYFASLPADLSKVAETNSALIGFARSRPEVVAAEANPSGTAVWVTFKGGRQFIIFNSHDEGNINAGRMLKPRNTGQDLPRSTQARILNAMDNPAAVSNNREIANLLSAPGSGYIPLPQDGTVDVLKKVSKDGVFYFNGHGATDSKRQNFALMTATPVRKINGITETTYAADMTGPRPLLIESIYREPIVGGTERIHNFYCITPEFVTQYMSFGENSFVYIDSCESDSPGAQTFKQAVLNKGASVYAGWTGPVQTGTAIKAAKFVFTNSLGDRGANGAQNFVSIKQLMGKQTPRLDIQDPPYPGSENSPGLYPAQLVFTPGEGHLGQLAPTVDAAVHDKSTNLITIRGTFGSALGSPRSVALGATVLPSANIRSWSPTKIECLADGVKPGRYNLRVSARGHLSNVVPIQIAPSGKPPYLVIRNLHVKVLPALPSSNSTVNITETGSGEIVLSKDKMPGGWADYYLAYDSNYGNNPGPNTVGSYRGKFTSTRRAVTNGRTLVEVIESVETGTVLHSRLEANLGSDFGNGLGYFTIYLKVRQDQTITTTYDGVGGPPTKFSQEGGGRVEVGLGSPFPASRVQTPIDLSKYEEGTYFITPDYRGRPAVSTGVMNPDYGASTALLRSSIRP